MKVSIEYEDEDILVCVKPAGMPAQADKSRDPDLLSYLKNRIYEKEKLEEEPYLALIHRLDRPVGGWMVFARNQKAAASLSDQVQDGRMVKYYQAILTGELPGETGTLEDYLLRDGKTNVSSVVKANTAGAKKAILHYEVLDVMETEQGILSYVLIELETGRHHQIRVQTANRGAGIYGDTKYNPKACDAWKKYRQIALFATRLEFEHPTKHTRMKFQCDPEGDIFSVIDLEEI